MYLSRRVQQLKASPIRRLNIYAEEAAKRGIKIHHLNIGQPDIETPRVFFDAIANCDIKTVKYEHSRGTKELISKIQKYYERLGIHYNEDEIIITSGGSEAILLSLIAIFDEGDEMLVSEPYYANYNSFYDILNIKRNVVRTYAEDGFHLPSREIIEKSITKKTKGYLFSNPSNPTGVVSTKRELDDIAYLAKKHDFFIISDEVYREFVYGDRKAISFGSYNDIAENVIIIDSISKRFSACGARIGCIISKNKEFMEAIFKECQARLSVPTLEMIGASALYDLPSDYFEATRNEYDNRRKILFEELTKMDGVFMREPEGAFYVLAQLPVKDAEDFAIWLLKDFNIDNETVMFAPAEGFYATESLGRNEIRMCYVLNSDDLKKAMRILKEGLIKYKKEVEK
ncbi:pyridoxal phosphate-dependent aminotransferase [Brachyspira hyodysenteriae]|uniref:pyridoxal phosphate-dependent aminotransferase n=1 Tax=Brachyspira hyodysenteriae TaxID=159 RepID=UPI00063DDAA5|nr:pyridoxal phosphate-dependent aminotransferase [Brachyspira hyodysenteriae]KLI22923.1 aspartate aminotransferase [Brachyspira hyodysenteriae]MCZ9885919.1 pyridoxal phosphate-dependent aminotransferase [Brachyspira hyodysenteriae]TVL56815.1 aspartate aminotransferase [Brachyspira hyodysenteriae]TVL59969.1 aspartate aminotransferase [Brachyspira hyodysenteriae]TVL63558.1 aspartate aminotransferase [Brachyspira hyodysenteriae]